ncbi:MAG: universal stress protein [Bacteroidota bacterium]
MSCLAFLDTNTFVGIVLGMKNVLVPIDFSMNAWNAIRYAQQLFRETSCTFYVLHVDSAPKEVLSILNNGNIAVKETLTTPRKRLGELVQRAKKTFFNSNHVYVPLIEHGQFIEYMKKTVHEKNIDLIVMGTKGASGLREHIIGSNTGDVITKVQCDVLVIPEGVQFKKPKEIAFPTDYNSFYSYKILNAISEIGKLDDSAIRVMNVVKSGSILTKEQQQNKEYLFDYLNEIFTAKNSFHTITNKNVNAAIQCFVESREIDMITMVAKNLNFLQQILFDSLIEKISFHTKVPFFVIHE